MIASVDTIEHCGWMSEDGTLRVEDAVTQMMLEKGTTVVPTMAVWYRPGYDDIASLSADQKKMRAGREARTASWAAMHKAGVRFATGTDTWDPFSRELELMVNEMKLSVMDTLVAATRNSAIALGLEDQIGTVAPGKQADLVLLDGDPLTDLGALRRVARVWRAGRQAVAGGQVIDAD
ncbi:MAG: hypothetical protein EXR61_06335 [Chloroflexi bacterium]|nr:hypothetical protein [Chloroflexota bacterium]